MNSRDRSKLLKFDIGLLELEAEIVAVQELERASGAKFFLRSKGLLAKHDKYTRMRANLMRSVSKRTTRAETYRIILAERTEARDYAAKQVDSALQAIASFISIQQVKTSDYLGIEMAQLKAILRSKRMLLIAKERAVDNWLNKSEYDSIKEKPQRVVSKEAAMTVQQRQTFKLKTTPDFDPTIASFVLHTGLNKSSVEKFEQLVENTAKPTNNATLDLLMNPTGAQTETKE